MPENHYVYLYQSSEGRVKYVGYGMNVERAIAHANQSHNLALRQWLDSARFNLTVAGPYRDRDEGTNIEAALISALGPDFNQSPGEGHRFVPLGVPPALSDRPGLNPLTVASIGSIACGALLVYLAPGKVMKDGRPKFDPANVDDDVILQDMDRAWSLTKLIERWKSDPDKGPRHLVGVYGANQAHRFIAGVVPIDRFGWDDPSLHIDKDRWRIPVIPMRGLDACELRGRRILDAKFGRMSWQLHKWVDADGMILHPPPAN
jgi:hypothetical protein